MVIRGGYAGCGASDPYERDLTAYEDNPQRRPGPADDGPDFAGYDENCYHVVTAYDVDFTTLIEGPDRLRR